MIPRVTEIETMDRAALLAAWDTLMGRPVPKGLSQPFLRRMLAFEVQARAQGGLPKGFAKTLARAVADAGSGRARGTALKPGGRLIRDWNGMTHVVEVGENGFLWQGQRYRSLSAIARAITGAQWSGPRFFGLRSGASK